MAYIEGCCRSTDRQQGRICEARQGGGGLFQEARRHTLGRMLGDDVS